MLKASSLWYSLCVDVLSGITLPCAPVSTLTRSVAVVSGLSFSVILRVAYTSSLSTALMLTVLQASGSKLSLTWSNLASWLIECTPLRWRSSRLVLRLDLARDLGRPEVSLPPAPHVQPADILAASDLVYHMRYTYCPLLDIDLWAHDDVQRRYLLSTSAWLMCSPRPADVTDAASVSWKLLHISQCCLMRPSNVHRCVKLLELAGLLICPSSIRIYLLLYSRRLGVLILST